MMSAVLVIVAESRWSVAEFRLGELRSAKISFPEVWIRRQRCVRQQPYGYLCTVAPVHRMGHDWRRAMIDIETNEQKVRKEGSMVGTLKSQKS